MGVKMKPRKVPKWMDDYLTFMQVKTEDHTVWYLIAHGWRIQDVMYL